MNHKMRKKLIEFVILEIKSHVYPVIRTLDGRKVDVIYAASKMKTRNHQKCCLDPAVER